MDTRRTYGYIRVSSIDQNTTRQRIEIEGHHPDRIFEDKASGKDTKRPALEDLRTGKYIRPGDTVVVHSMDRLARSLADLRTIVEDFTGQGARVQFIKEGQMFTGEDSPMANLMLNLLGSFAEFERSLIRERQAEGIAAAKKRGVYKGRKPSVTPEVMEQVNIRIAKGDTKTQIARDLGISRETLYQHLRNSRK